MPDVNHDEDIFNTHLLEQTEQLLATSFFIAVIKALCNVSWLVIVVIWCHSVGDNTSFGIYDASATSQVLKYEIDVVLVTNGCGKRLVLGMVWVQLLFPETYWIQYTFHFFKELHNFVSHINIIVVTRVLFVRNYALFLIKFGFQRFTNEAIIKPTAIFTMTWNLWIHRNSSISSTLLNFYLSFFLSGWTLVDNLFVVKSNKLFLFLNLL